MNRADREMLLRYRKEHQYPLHAPPHDPNLDGKYLITAACFEHIPHFDSPDLLSFLTEEVLYSFHAAGISCDAWSFLPNHYHALADTTGPKAMSEMLRKMHSRIATQLNSTKKQRGTKIFYRFADRKMRSERHYWTTINYIHHNPVKHGYVDKMEDWPWSSYSAIFAADPDHSSVMWDRYPLFNYGKGWDD